MNDVASADTRAQTARDLRRARARRLAIRLAIGLGVPTLIATVYYGFLATPQYESVSSFTVQSADGSVPASIEMLIAAVPGNSAARDSLLVQQYILSRDMLRHLSDEHGFVEHYTDSEIDFASRLDPDASFEERFEYYQDRVEIDYESQSGILTLRVRAFDADKAQELARAILAASESMVNQMMLQARRDRIELAQREVTSAEERLGEARQAILELQAERSELNPEASAEALYGVRGNLETELATARAELATMRATLQPGAPALVQQQQRVSALARQVEEQNQRLAGTEEGGLSEAIASFEPAMAEKEFAQRAYQSALKSLEVARLEADRQHRYVVTIAEPSLPDYPEYPKVLLSILTVFVLSFALLSIGTLLVASVREHANV